MAKVSSYLLFMRPDRNTKIQGVDQVMSQFGLTARRRPDYFEIDSTDARALEQWANTVGAPTSPKNVQVSLNQVNGWEMLNVLDFKTGIPEIKLIDEIHPIQPEEWLAWQSPEGKIQRNQDEVLADISRRGLDPSVRSTAWHFLLELYPWTSSEADRSRGKDIYIERYRAKKRKWEEIQDNDERWNDLCEQFHRIEKDVVRTDREDPYFCDDPAGTQAEQRTTRTPNEQSRSSSPSSAFWTSRIQETNNLIVRKHLEMLRDILITYAMSDDVGYSQGMSDIVSTLLIVFGSQVSTIQLGLERPSDQETVSLTYDEEIVASETYFAFERIMKSMRPNFLPPSLPGCIVALRLVRHVIQVLFPPLYQILANASSLHLLFLFRWVLVNLKRELATISHVARVWEKAWSRTLGFEDSDPFYINVWCVTAGLVGSLGIPNKTGTEWGLGGWLRSQVRTDESSVLRPIAFEDVLEYINRTVSASPGNRGQLSDHVEEILAGGELFLSHYKERVLQSGWITQRTEIIWENEEAVTNTPSKLLASQTEDWSDGNCASALLGGYW